MSDSVDGDTLGSASLVSRSSVSGPVPRAADDGDARAARMAEFLGWCVGRDLDAIDGLLDRLGAVTRGELHEMSAGLNDTELHVDPWGARIHDDVVDLDLGENPDGIAYSHAELEGALRWWRDVIRDWAASRR